MKPLTHIETIDFCHWASDHDWYHFKPEEYPKTIVHYFMTPSGKEVKILEKKEEKQ